MRKGQCFQKRNCGALTGLVSALNVLAKLQSPFFMLFPKAARLYYQAELMAGAQKALGRVESFYTSVKR